MIISALLLQDQTNSAAGAAIGGVFSLLMLAVVVVFIIGMWKVFEKAGQPGWAALIPIYNTYILIKIAGKPGWWLLLMLIPLVNFVIVLLLSLDVAKAFGQSPVFGVVLLFLLGPIGYLVLGFGNYSYVGTPGMVPARA